MGVGEQNLAHLVRAQHYRPIDYFLDGLFAAGQGFNSNSPYHRGRLVVPGRFVMGEFEVAARDQQLVLQKEMFFIDRTPEALYKYERQVPLQI